MYKTNKPEGFTLLELITVVALIMVLASLIFPTYANLQSSTSLNDAKDQTIQLLRAAKTNACSGKFDQNCGVYFDNSQENPKIVLFYGDDYSSRVLELDEEIDFGKSTIFTNSFSDDQVVFEKYGCLPSESGFINISSHTVQHNYSISLNSLGIVGQ